MTINHVDKYDTSAGFVEPDVRMRTPKPLSYSGQPSVNAGERP